ncbi:TRAP transporter large permease subunit, partial [bacterium]|nr:TRAP transporter large permease subunit [bacterium]
MALVGFLLFGLFFFLLFMEVPVAFALGISAITTIYVFDLTFTDEIARQLFYAMDSYTLLAIPLFLLVGHLLGKSKLAKNLLDLVMILAGGIRGGVAIVTVIVSLLFAGISGSGPADVAALGVLLFPLLKESGFTPSRSAALLAAGGGIGIIVPPSIALIIYGVVAEASIGKLFIAGIVPGILISLSLIIAVRFLARKDRLVVQKPPLTWDVLFGSLLAMMAPLVILGGIYSGTFTPTES